MTEQQISATLDELIALVAAGKPLEAFEIFYHDDVEKTELDGVTLRGKDANRQAGVALLSKVQAMRDFSPAGKIVKGNRSVLVWSIDYDHADAGPVKVTEVAIQDWQDGKIIRERFIA